MERMNSKTYIKPLIWTAFFIASFMACLLLLFLSMTVGTAYSISSWLTSTPQVAALIYRTGTLDPTEMAMLSQTVPVLITEPASLPPAENVSQVTEPVVNLPEPTEEMTATSTQTPLPTEPLATPTINLTETQMAKDIELTPLAANMQDYVNSLFNNSTIKNNFGTYFRLPDYQGQSSEPGNAPVTSTDLRLSDFVLRANVHWQVDNLGGDWAESGCGILFRADEDGNYYMIYLSLDGRGRLFRKLNGSSTLIGRSTIYNVDRNDGLVKLIIILEGDRLRYFVDGKLVYDTYCQPQIGKLEWTTITGNKNGFGTSCEINNIDVWKIGK